MNVVDGNGTGFNLERVGLLLALVSGITGAGLSLVGTEDRYYGSQGRVAEIKIENLTKQFDRIESVTTSHLATHPDRGLQIQINEVREELIRIKAEIARD